MTLWSTLYCDKILSDSAGIRMNETSGGLTKSDNDILVDSLASYAPVWKTLWSMIADGNLSSTNVDVCFPSPILQLLLTDIE